MIEPQNAAKMAKKVERTRVREHFRAILNTVLRVKGAVKMGSEISFKFFL